MYTFHPNIQSSDNDGNSNVIQAKSALHINESSLSIKNNVVV